MAYPLLMMTNRNVIGDQLGQNVTKTKYFRFQGDPAVGSQLHSLDSWGSLTKPQFVKTLQDIAAGFPVIDIDRTEDQQHVSVFVHGYNNSWKGAVDRYAQIKADLFDTTKLGCVVLFTWPSNGSPADYLPDREDARDSATAFAAELVDLHDQVLKMQSIAATANDPTKGCKAKISIIAHSMGNYVTQKALAIAAKQLNSPQLVTLITQLAMVAADVDNDIFQSDKPSDSDGSLMANLCYRIGALYTGLDQVLGASAGLKHFGTRRLGRSGLADPNNVWDNVFDKDVSAYLDTTKSIHSAVFDSPKALKLLEMILRGVDRAHLP